jgi:hypothetical protein
MDYDNGRPEYDSGDPGKGDNYWLFWVFIIITIILGG